MLERDNGKETSTGVRPLVLARETLQKPQNYFKDNILDAHENGSGLMRRRQTVTIWSPTPQSNSILDIRLNIKSHIP